MKAALPWLLVLKDGRGTAAGVEHRCGTAEAEDHQIQVHRERDRERRIVAEASFRRTYPPEGEGGTRLGLMTMLKTDARKAEAKGRKEVSGFASRAVCVYSVGKLSEGDGGGRSVGRQRRHPHGFALSDNDMFVKNSFTSVNSSSFSPLHLPSVKLLRLLLGVITYIENSWIIENRLRRRRLLLGRVRIVNFEVFDIGCTELNVVVNVIAG